MSRYSCEAECRVLAIQVLKLSEAHAFYQRDLHALISDQPTILCDNLSVSFSIKIRFLTNGNEHFV